MKTGKIYKRMLVALSVIMIIAGFAVIFFTRPSFGSLPRGERLHRIENSPNYRDGSFRNLSETPQLTSDKNFVQQVWEFLFRRHEGLRPDGDIPVVRTDLRALNPGEDVLVWLGHGSYYFRSGGMSFVVDPVFYDASPVGFYNKAFKGTAAYRPDDLPDIDYFIISHDHWDHLDYRTVKEMNARTGHFICPLGVGAHLERWGVEPGRIIEMDWNDYSPLGDGFGIHCLPSRHFSGRGLRPNRSLWASYMLETPSGRTFIGGDGGYDTHFGDIGRRFHPIDLAILENGQYGEGWKYIHLLPDDLVKAVTDLASLRVLTVHNSKYALAMHRWDEPLDRIAESSAEKGFDLITPMIGEVVRLPDTSQVFGRWWK